MFKVETPPKMGGNSITFGEKRLRTYVCPDYVRILGRPTVNTYTLYSDAIRCTYVAGIACTQRMLADMPRAVVFTREVVGHAGGKPVQRSPVQVHDSLSHANGGLLSVQPRRRYQEQPVHGT